MTILAENITSSHHQEIFPRTHGPPLIEVEKKYRFKRNKHFLKVKEGLGGVTALSLIHI